MDEAELTKSFGVHMDQVMNPRKTDVPLPMVERTAVQSSQLTVFWNALPEDCETMDSIGPQFDRAPHPLRKEEMFLQDPFESLRFPSPESDNGTRTQFKVKNYQLGGKEPVETPRRGRRRTQEKVSSTAEMQEERCTPNRGQGTEPLWVFRKSGELTKSLKAVCSHPSPMDKERGKVSFSKYGRRYRPKSTLVFEHSGEECNEGPLLWEEIQPKSDLDEHDGSPMEEKNHDCPESGVRLHSKSSAKHQLIHARGKTYKCPGCRKSFSQRSELRRHEIIHTGEKPHHCPECGKKFAWRSAFLRHQSIHTGKKPHHCLECGKSYSQRSILFRHQMIHTGKKLHKYLDQVNSFSQRYHLLRHQEIHAEKQPHKCPECGKIYSHRSSLLRHRSIHTGENPHKCHICKKSFFHKSGLVRHQNMHTGEKPHKCHNCGKSFSQRCHLSRHAMIHTGNKPGQYPEYGKGCFQQSHFFSH